MTQNRESANAAIANLVNTHLANTQIGKKFDNPFDDQIHHSSKELSVKKFDDELKGLRKSVLDSFNKVLGNILEFKDLMADLNSLKETYEKLSDLKLGIFRIEVPKDQGVGFVGAKASDKSAVVIRDARLQEQLKTSKSNYIVDNPNKVREAWMVNATANTMGFMKLIELSDSPNKSELQKEVLKRFHDCIDDISKSTSPKERSHSVQEMNNEMKTLLQAFGGKVGEQSFKKMSDKEFSKILLNVRDFTNFERDHKSTVTISANLAEGLSANHVESFVPVVPMSDSLKANYNDLENQSWYKALNPINKKLVDSYKDRITDGNHIIPTQLQFLPGVRNYGLSSTFFARDGEIDHNHQHSFMRSGTPAYNNAKSIDGDKQGMQNITNQNVEHIAHIASLSGQTVNFNTVTNEIGNERKMGQAVRKAVAYKTSVELDIGRDHLGESDTDSLFENSEKNNAKSTITKAPLSVTLSNKHRNLSNAWKYIKEGISEMVHIGCKSGKDRTGLHDKHHNLKATEEFLKNVYASESSTDPDNKPDYKKAYEAYNAGQHNEILAGSDGGSYGCYGLKASTSYNLPINKLSPKNILHSIKRFTIGNKEMANLNIPHLGYAEIKGSVKTEAEEIGSEIKPMIHKKGQTQSDHFDSHEMNEDVGLLGGETKKTTKGLRDHLRSANKIFKKAIGHDR